jgi:ATP-dependent DNA helicase RecQ
MDEHQFALVQALIEENDDMRVIAVGDDDQNIFEGIHKKNGSGSVNLSRFMDLYRAKKYELVENYRSIKPVVDFSNRFVQDIPNRLKENPIASVKEGSGAVRIRRFASASLEYPILNHIKKYPPTGTVGVLTQTNDDALKVMAFLNHEKIKAKLIQDSDGFALRDLMEFRSFLKWIQKENEPIISTEDWNSAVERLKVKYQRSSILALCLRALDVYKNQSDRLYRNDFKLFLMESKISDFDRGTKKEVVVSTIHKAKGREFDRVYVMVKDPRRNTEQDRRVLYVGFTRAKNQLYVFHCCPFLEKYAPEKLIDNTKYPEPAEIICQFGHKDMWLDYFYGEVSGEGAELKKRIFSLCAGMPLRFRGGCLYDLSSSKNAIAVLSKDAKAKIKHLEELGYFVKNARVRYIVAWNNKERDDECPIILPEIEMERRS